MHNQLRQQGSTAAVRMAAALALLAVFIVAGNAAEGDALKERGRVLVSRMCAECHAIGMTGESPHLAAPAFRRLDSRLDLQDLVGRMRRGLMSGHQDMPMFRFTRDEAQAVVAYLKSIQAP